MRTEVPKAAPKVDIKLQTGDSNPQRSPRENHEDCGVRSWPRRLNVGPADRPAELGGHPLLSALEG